MIRLPITRYDLVSVINQRKYEYGAEVGCCQGLFSYYLLRHSNLKLLHSIDSFTGRNAPWKAEAESMLSEFGARSILHHKASRQAAAEFAANGEQLDFVYIDADHRYPYVRYDIRIWWPLVTPGGLLSGHDYCAFGNYGVIHAVDEFVAREKLQLSLTREMLASWLIFKP